MSRSDEYNWAPGFEVREAALADQYESGLVGCLHEPEEDEHLDEVIRDGGGDPNGGDGSATNSNPPYQLFGDYTTGSWTDRTHYGAFTAFWIR